MDDSEIVWLPVVGYEGLFEVSSDGRVRSLDRIVTTKTGVRKTHRGRILSQHPDDDGYFRVGLSNAGRHRKRRVHSLVAESFIGPRPDGMEVCHNDSNRQNNHVSNLRYDTHSNNVLDAVANGTWGPTSKEYCPAGHEYTKENTYMYNGSRTCRECQRKRAREWFRDNKSKSEKFWKKPEL